MKFTLPLLLAAVAEAATPERRQVFAQNGGAAILGGLSKATPKRAFKIEDIKAKTPGAKRMKILYGPYVLKAAGSTAKVGDGVSMDPGGTAYQNLVDDDFPRDITVLEASSQIVDERFKRAETNDGIYNHHNAFFTIKPSQSPYACKGAQPKPPVPITVFMAGAAEEGHVQFSNPSLAVKTGFYLPKNRIMLNMIDVVNYNKVDRTVYTESEIEYLPGKQEGWLDTFVATIDPGLCSGQLGANIHSPKDQKTFTVNGTGITIVRDGYIHGMRGHLHDGGVNIVLKINDKEICNSKAIYGGEGHVGKNSNGQVWETIRDYSECATPFKVNKGDIVFIQAFYDVGLHPAREQGVHGSMMMGSKGMKKRGTSDDGMAEQMALFQTFFSGTS